MGRIKNMGTGTMQFKEGIILTGSAHQPNGTDSDYTLVTSGSVFVTDSVVVSGSLLSAKHRHITTNKFNISNTAQNYLRFDAAGQNQPNAGENNMFLAPANGRLISVHIRTQGAAGNTTIKLFKNTDTYEHTNDDSGNRVFETELQSVQENISAAFTTVKFTFGSAASFNEGDALGISIQGTSNPNAGNLTCIWEFDFVS